MYVFVQARMGSQRCPGKSLEKIGGVPSIEIVLKRIQKAESISKVVLCTSAEQIDDPLSDFVTSLGFDVFRGSHLDLVERFAEATSRYKVTTTLRATGDNTFMCGRKLTKL